MKETKTIKKRIKGEEEVGVVMEDVMKDFDDLFVDQGVSSTTYPIPEERKTLEAVGETVEVTIAYIIELYHSYDDEKLDLMATLRKIRGDNTSNDKDWEKSVEKDKRPSVVLLFNRYKELCKEIHDLRYTVVIAPDTMLDRAIEPFPCDVDD